MGCCFPCCRPGPPPGGMYGPGMRGPPMYGPGMGMRGPPMGGPGMGMRGPPMGRFQFKENRRKIKMT